MAQKILSSIIRFRIKRKTIEMIKLMIVGIIFIGLVLALATNVILRHVI